MQRLFLHVLVTMLFVLMVGAPTAHAEDMPHQPSLMCTSCHLDVMNNAAAGTIGVNNLCLTCHNPAKMSSAFNIKDMANPFGSTDLGAYTTEPIQSSHNWAAPVNVPGAGAQIALDPAIRDTKATFAGVISCASCHDPHAWSGKAGISSKLLRLPLEGDKLCFDCHRSRNTRSHLTGTHPVNFNYTSATSKVRTKPGDYYALPLSSNPSNTTAAMKLSSGRLNCSTCHGVHFTDSNSNTFDNHSSSALGKLTPSQGYLLRTDMRGASATSINICTNCHANKVAHNYKGQNIQCADCHAGHVDAGDGTAPNVWLVRRYMNYSGGVQLDSYRRKAFYQYTGSKRNFAGPFGVCQACHTVPTGDAYPPEHTSTDPAVCASCHSHNSTSGSFSGGCTTCHGFPPVLNVPGGPNGYAKTGTYDYVASGVFKDETKTAHDVHAGKNPYGFKCAECHAGNRHASGNFQQVFIAKTGILAATGGMVPQYNTSTSNCSSVYCHSNGDGGTPNNTTFTWTSPAGSLGCTGCHGSTSTSANPITTGKHGAHVDELACTECHAKTISTSTSFSNRSNHVNGMKDYSGSRAGSYNSATKQCSNVYCHSNGNPNALAYTNPAAWNSSTTYGCNGCHGTGNALGAPDYTNGGTGTALANSHNAHTSGYADTSVCSNCHFATASTTGGKLVTNSAHLNKVVNVNFDPAVAGPSASYDPVTGTCSNIACHGNSSAQWGGKGGCLGCHANSINKRAAITSQFGANSHHIQDVTVSGEHCYQCHWEANSDGSINRNYHHSSTPGGPVELVIYGAGARPTTYTVGTTAIQYLANGSRTEMAKLNSVCIGCHSEQNKTIQPFGDGKTPAIYAWDGSSAGAKYADTATTNWGKYTGTKITPKAGVVKAFSAHGNAAANKGGWNTAETWADRGATANVLCFDCHNSHGSNISGITTSYASATINGGILKETEANKGGYAVSYKPVAGGSVAEKNAYAPGAGICFDCHMKDSATSTPWGYQTTYGSTQQIMSYWDSAYFGNNTFGNQLRYSYKGITGHKGGHFGASASLTSPALNGISGLCTPCHDPHGVSPVLGTNKQYGVPLLKGTWLTSPYKEDVATADNTAYQGMDNTSGEEGPRASSATTTAFQNAINSYHIDQNTFSTTTNYNAAVTGIVETDVQFGGLCLRCHTKANLTNGTTNTWKDKNRIHQAVKGWKTANTTKQHNYSCSKCHTVHNSDLPKLMVTNCLDATHRGRVGYNSNPVTSSSYRGGEGNGGGQMPGIFGGGEGGRSGRGSWGGGSWSSTGSTTASSICHDNYDPKQLWNNVTPWSSTAAPPSTGPTMPTLIAEPNTTCSSACAVTLQWNASTNTGGAGVQYQVQVSSSNTFATIAASSGWISGTSYAPTLANGTWYWRVQARDSVATTKVSTWSTVGSFTISATALSTTPTVPALIAEEDGTCAATSCGFTLSWNPSAISSGAIQYSVQVSASSSFSTIKASSGWISTTSYTPSLGTGTWYWRVQARSASTTTRVSAYSAVDSFVVSVPAPTPTAPSTPSLIAETDSTCSTASCGIALAWNASSVTGGTAQYSVEVSNSSTFSTIAAASDWISGTTYTPSLAAGTWYWRVQARNASSTALISAWSTVDTFVISVPAPVTTPPSKPVLTAEPDGTCRTYSGCSIGLAWSTSTNPSGGTVEYLIQVSNSSTFTSIKTQSAWQTGRTWNAILPSGTWYWRVQARDAANALTSAWSNVDSFRLSN